jgi:hypothetical protein
MRQPARGVNGGDSQGEETSSDDIISDTNCKCDDSDSGVQEFESMLKICHSTGKEVIPKATTKEGRK